MIGLRGWGRLLDIDRLRWASLALHTCRSCRSSSPQPWQPPCQHQPSSSSRKARATTPPLSLTPSLALYLLLCDLGSRAHLSFSRFVSCCCRYRESVLPLYPPPTTRLPRYHQQQLGPQPALIACAPRLHYTHAPTDPRRALLPPLSPSLLCIIFLHPLLVVTFIIPWPFAVRSTQVPSSRPCFVSRISQHHRLDCS